MTSIDNTPKSYEAMAFYEKYVDLLKLRMDIEADEKYPDFPLNECQREFSAPVLKAQGWIIRNDPKGFKRFVAGWFDTTIEEMDKHWRSFKDSTLIR